MTGEVSPLGRGDEAASPGEFRASHEDRDGVAELLRVAAGDGRLTAEELDERLEKALTARTYGELAALSRDRHARRAGPSGSGSGGVPGPMHCRFRAAGPDLQPSRTRPWQVSGAVSARAENGRGRREIPGVRPLPASRVAGPAPIAA
jgi:Domain of unknown function (DUF1707)